MREIRFRAWDGAKMHNVCRLGMRGFSTDLWSASPVMCDSRMTSELMIMQFTGLLDKNGKEIYEGDIVRCPVCKPERGHIVEWREGIDQDGYGVCLDVDCDLPWRWKNFEVIGNVFEHPELLK